MNQLSQLNKITTHRDLPVIEDDIQEYVPQTSASTPTHTLYNEFIEYYQTYYGGLVNTSTVQINIALRDGEQLTKEHSRKALRFQDATLFEDALNEATFAYAAEIITGKSHRDSSYQVFNSAEQALLNTLNYYGLLYA